MEVNGVTLAASYLVHNLPDVSSDAAARITLFAGHIQVSQWKYFHILVNEHIKAPAIPKANKKLLFWFNGGPGCSSMDGMFLENGPLRFDTSKSPPSLIINEKGWWKEADVAYIDHPPGTGYSLGDPFSSTAQVVDLFEVFLEQFLDIYPVYKNTDIYIAGESFAGVWIPLITSRLIEIGRPVVAILLGSPWIDPYFQYPAILDYSKEKSLISGTWLAAVESKRKSCVEELKPTPRRNTYQSCERIMETILEASQDGGAFCMNKYDYTLRDQGPDEGCGMSWPDGVKEMKVYLARNDVKSALHATQYLPYTWEECSFSVYNSIIEDTGEPTISLFPKLLKSVRISVYGGERDVLCNVLGLERSLQSLGVDGISTKEEIRLKSWGRYGTKFWVGGNLSYFRLVNASHMSPFDAPEASHEVFLELIQPQSISSALLMGGASGPSQQPSHLLAAFFLLVFFFVAIFGGLYIRRKLRTIDQQPKWNAVPAQTDEEIEMQEPYDYEGRHLTSGMRD